MQCAITTDALLGHVTAHKLGSRGISWANVFFSILISLVLKKIRVHIFTCLVGSQGTAHSVSRMDLGQKRRGYHDD